jgi:hypothetical protein
VAGRTRPRSRHTWPHPFVSTRLLKNWTALTCTGFLVLLLHVIHYPAFETLKPTLAAAVINKYRPGRGRPGPKQTGHTRPNSRPAAGRPPISCTGTQAIQVHPRHNSVSRSMYAVPWIYDSDDYRTVHLHLTLTSLVVAHVHLHLTLTSPVVTNLQCCIAQ